LQEESQQEKGIGALIGMAEILIDSETKSVKALKNEPRLIR
jgi:hypothetical protein